MTETRKVQLMIDSGAFSVWRSGAEINPAKYAKFIKKWEPHLHSYFTLDVMPGQRGRTPSVREVEEAAQQSYKNLKDLERRGIKPVPIYHFGERRYWLEKLVGEGYDYIGLSFSGRARTGSDIRYWLDQCFDYLCCSDGYPSVRLHGLGVTALPVLFRYPWFSVDSTSWLMVGGYGGIYVPHWDEQRQVYDYSRQPMVVILSEEGRKSGRGLKAHIDHLGPNLRKYALKFIEEEGFELEVLARERYERVRFVMRVLVRVSQLYVPRPYHRRSSSLFGSMAQEERGRPLEPLKIFFVTGPGQEKYMNEEGATHRLISYTCFMGHDRHDIARYARRGRFKKRQRESI